MTKDISPYATVGGVPAQIIWYRFGEKNNPELIENKIVGKRSRMDSESCR